MNARDIRLVLGLVGLASATVALYLFSNLSNHERFEALDRELTYLEELDARLEANVLTLRYLISNDYDELSALTRDMQLVFASILDHLDSLGMRTVGEVPRQQLFSKLEQAETFKSTNSVLRNAHSGFLQWMHILIAEVQDNSTPGLAQVQELNTLSTLEASGVRYTLTYDSQARSDFAAGVEDLETLMRAGTVKGDFESVFKHARILKGYVPQANASLSAMLNDSMRDVLKPIKTQLATLRYAEERRANSSNLLLLAWAVALLVYSGYKFWQVNRFAGQLAELNQGLEERVSERTEDLEHAQVQMRLILESIAQGICGFDLKGDLVFTNAVAGTWLGSTNECESTFIGPSSPVKQALLRGETTRGLERTVVGVDGVERPLEIGCYPMLEQDEVKGAVLTLTDTTYSKQAQAEVQKLNEELRLAQRLEAVGQLAAGVAHEINTPTQYVGDNVGFAAESFGGLMTLLNAHRQSFSKVSPSALPEEDMAELARLEEELDLEFVAEEVPLALEQAREGVQRISEIVRAMKQFAHPGGEAKESFDINRVIRSTVTVARNEWKYVAELELDLDEELPWVWGYPAEMGQVFLNLVVNASHAIGEHGGDNQEKGHIRIATRQEGDCVVAEVSDDGPGVPAHIRERIFDPFFTTKEVGKGTGQGLSIARSVVVEKHGGTLNLNSPPTGGTSFSMSLPTSEARADGSHTLSAR